MDQALPNTLDELRALLRRSSTLELAAMITRTTATVQSGALDGPQFDHDLHLWVTELDEEVKRRSQLPITQPN